MSRDALVVGINQYENISTLRSPSEDAETLAQLLVEYGDFKVTRLPAVKDKQNNAHRVGRRSNVSLLQIEDALVKLFKPTGPNVPETAIFFFSGHGLRKERGIQEGFLATSEVNPARNSYGLSLQWLRRLLQESPVQQQIVWLDCCYSGELLNFDEANPEERGQDRSCHFIAASREYEVAYEEVAGNHGVLTEALLQALDPNHRADGKVTNFTVTDFVRQRLSPATQLPLFHNSGGKIILTGRQPLETVRHILEGVCPYKGLQSFDCNDEDAKYFYGRTELTNKLQRKVSESNFLAVLGASGSGKSSVVRAGLLYQLKTEQQPDSTPHWFQCTMRPDKHPQQSLAQHLTAALVEPELPTIERADKLQKVQNLIDSGSVGLSQLIATIPAERAILTIDQFEECFTLCQDDAERQQFFQCLLGALDRTGNKLCLVLVMRADFLNKCLEQDYAGLAKKIEANLVTVPPMNSGELREAIVEPAKQVGLTVEEDLIAQILHDVEKSPGYLPLLQYALTELWKRRAVNWLTLSAYNHLGGVSGALQQRAEAVYASLSPEEQKIVERIFLELTQLGEGTEDTRRRVLKQEFFASQSSGKLVDRVIQKLAAERLIVTDELRAKSPIADGGVAIDVAHEALIRHWPRLRQWIEENRIALQQKRQIERAAEQWQNNGKPSRDFLLQGLQLATAEKFQQNYAETMPLSGLSLEFIRRSAQRRRESRLFIYGGVATFILGLSMTTIWAYRERNKAIHNEISALANVSEAYFQQDNQLEALVEGVKAGKKLKQIGSAPNKVHIQTVVALEQAIYDTQERNRLGHDGAVDSVAFSSDGQTIAAAGEGGTIQLWNEDGTAIGNPWHGHEGYVRSVSFSPNGKMLVSASDDGTAKLWNMDGTLHKTLEGHDGPVNNARFSPDSQMIISAGHDNMLRLWNVQGDLLKTFRGHEAIVWSARFGPDGTMIVSGSDDNTVRLWSRDGTLKKTLKGHNGPVYSVGFSPDGTVVASVSNDNTVRLWHSKDNYKQPSILRGHEKAVRSVSFSADGHIVSASNDGTVKLWSQDGKVINTFRGHSANVVSVDFRSNDKTIASASNDNTVRLWRPTSRVTFEGDGDSTPYFGFSLDGKKLILASDKGLKLWDWEHQEPKTLWKYNDAIADFSVSPSSNIIALASYDKDIKLLRWDGGQLLHWEDGQNIRKLSGHRDVVRSLSFSPDGHSLISGSDDMTVRFWDLRTGKSQVLLKHDAPVTSVRFSPTGKIIASASTAGIIALWDVDRKETVQTLKGHNEDIASLSFSPNGQMLASASDDRTVILWSRKGNHWEEFRRLQGHVDWLTDARFSTDGKIIASASDDGTIKLWNRDGTFLKDLLVEEAGISSLSFSPANQRQIAYISGYTVKIVQLELNPLLEKACNRLKDYLKSQTRHEDRQICDNLG